MTGMPTVIKIAIAPIKTRAAVVVRRVVIARVVIRCRINIGTTYVVITAGQAQTKKQKEQYSAELFLKKHGGLLEDPQQQSAQAG
jgi:hypothetical protein